MIILPCMPHDLLSVSPLQMRVPLVRGTDVPAKGLAAFQRQREIQVVLRDGQTMECHPRRDSDFNTLDDVSVERGSLRHSPQSEITTLFERGAKEADREIAISSFSARKNSVKPHGRPKLVGPGNDILVLGISRELSLSESTRLPIIWRIPLDPQTTTTTTQKSIPS